MAFVVLGTLEGGNGMLGVFREERDAVAFSVRCEGSRVLPLPLEYPFFSCKAFILDDVVDTFHAGDTIDSRLAEVRDETADARPERIVVSVYFLERDFTSPFPCGFIESHVAHAHFTQKQLRATCSIRKLAGWPRGE